MKIVFAGTPDFAASSLMALLEANREIVAVYTQPDRPAGRGRKMLASPVKELAESHSVPVFQPESFKFEANVAPLAALKPDLMVVAAYGLILPPSVLAIPRYGCINIHASLLPRWRGAAPIQRAIMAGDKKTGITIMQMDEGLDTGAMLYSVETTISDEETGGTLHDRLAILGAEAILKALKNLETGQLTAVQQDNSLATYASKLNKSEAAIDWKRPATELERKIRAFNPWPIAHSLYQGKSLRIWQARAIDTDHNTQPGTVFTTPNRQIEVATGEGSLQLLELQLPGKKRISDRDFLNGRSVEGEILG